MPIEVTMPALSPTMEEGTLANWLVKEGDTIAAGDVIAEIETDKATMEVEAVEEGVLGKILVEAGTDNVKVNAPIALLLEDGEDESALEDYEPEGADASGSGESSSSKTPDKPASQDEESRSPQPEVRSDSGASKAEGVRDDAQLSAEDRKQVQTESDGERIKASPLARRIALQNDIDLASLTGSGPNGRIVKADVEAAIGKDAPARSEAKTEAPAKSDDAPAAGGPLAKFGIAEDRYELVKADNIQKVSAKRLTESFRDIPHFPLSVDITLDALLAFRRQINDKAEEGVKISVNDLLIKASGLALKKVPDSNASWTDEGIARHKHADVSVAVAIEGGLITPIIKDADLKGLGQISAEMKDLATRARERKLKPEEYQGGTFSLSNLGMYGIKNFASIINPPQGMIMSVGAGEERAVIQDGAVAKATVMSVTVTCDHRVVDGATGARFIAAFKGLVEDPLTMLL